MFELLAGIPLGDNPMVDQPIRFDGAAAYERMMASGAGLPAKSFWIYGAWANAIKGRLPERRSTRFGH
jgi:hypothetical protein